MIAAPTSRTAEFSTPSIAVTGIFFFATLTSTIFSTEPHFMVICTVPSASAVILPLSSTSAISLSDDSNFISSVVFVGDNS